jgi:thymidylate synthase (FAD)
MKIELLSYTPAGEYLIERAARVCYRSDPTPKSESGALIRKCIRRGHESVIEHANATFLIEGISRACSHQIVRHRLASYSQESQRYVLMNEIEFVVPVSIAINKKALEIYTKFLGASQMAYLELKALEIPKEDARFVLPNATPTRIVMTANLREYRHFIKVRYAPAAQWEIQRVADVILDFLNEIFPNVFFDLVGKE